MDGYLMSAMRTLRTLDLDSLRIMSNVYRDHRVVKFRAPTAVSQDRLEQDLRRRSIGTSLRDARKKAGLSQGELGAIFGYTCGQFVSNWERGISLPPIETLPRLAEVLLLPARAVIAAFHGYHQKLANLRKAEMAAMFRMARVARRSGP